MFILVLPISTQLFFSQNERAGELPVILQRRARTGKIQCYVLAATKVRADGLKNLRRKSTTWHRENLVKPYGA